MPKFNNAKEQAAWRANQEANERIILRRNCAASLRKLIAAGYKGSTTLENALYDLEHSNTPLSDRVGRGYSV